jgi:CheY-like chemotaxis protein
MKNTILIVDDERICRAMLEAVVKKLGFEAVLCDDGAAALALLKEKHTSYAAIFLDIYMPYIDGISALGHIRKNWPELSVVVISGSEDEEDERVVMQHGAIGYIRKPIQPAVIYSNLKNLLGALVSADTLPLPDQNTA